MSKRNDHKFALPRVSEREHSAILAALHHFVEALRGSEPLNPWNPGNRHQCRQIQHAVSPAYRGAVR